MVGLVVLICVVAGLLQFAWVALRYRNEEYVITTRRVIHTEGVLNKKSTDSSLEKINDAVLGVALRADVRVRRPRGPHRVGGGHRAPPDARGAIGFKKAMLEAKHDLELSSPDP